jgi:hypothetical protein
MSDDYDSFSHASFDGVRCSFLPPWHHSHIQHLCCPHLPSVFPILGLTCRYGGILRDGLTLS